MRGISVTERPRKHSKDGRLKRIRGTLANGDQLNVSLLHAFGVLRAIVEQEEHIKEFGDQVTMS